MSEEVKQLIAFTLVVFSVAYLLNWMWQVDETRKKPGELLE